VNCTEGCFFWEKYIHKSCHNLREKKIETAIENVVNQNDSA
jgi:hypothetical protein